MYQAQQGGLGQVHAVMTRVETGAQLLQRLVTVQVPDCLARQRRLAPHHLQRLVQVFPGQCRAQDVMALDHPVERLGERLQGSPSAAVRWW
ncbi:hypothetical protein WR25_13897 [Diploscapter pachys]|uniref:Uncharacterized protein n=1 Tax=Diploscapter pachys TaxID=2018661 RepID=A0A2A2M4D3_9BILA|nr:hypothetical protein WR25_13897 [Diploscapter pachys]